MFSSLAEVSVMFSPVVKRHFLRFRASLAKAVDGICLKCLDLIHFLTNKRGRYISTLRIANIKYPRIQVNDEL
jgi:hypothetical protein